MRRDRHRRVRCPGARQGLPRVRLAVDPAGVAATRGEAVSGANELDAPSGQWIAVADGFLYDPFLGGHAEVRDGVAYWVSGDSEWVLDLTDEAVAEAQRRNGRIRPRPEEKP